MKFSYRIAPSTVHSIIISTCEAIGNKLSTTELPQPTEEEWGKKRQSLIHYGSGFGCLVVSMLVPKFMGSNPAEAVGFFGRKKTPQHAFLRRGSKAVGPISQLCGM
jgi:hypothetical protein